MKAFIRKILLLAVMTLAVCPASWAATFSEAIAPAITTTSLTAGYVGLPYGFKLQASGTSSITWTASGLPSGLSINSSGYISGTPTAAGSSSVTVTATNSGGSDSSTLSLTISEPTSGAGPSITTDTLDIAANGESYTFQLAASGTPSITWSISGGLPAGLTMNQNGTITGIPPEKTPKTSKKSQKAFTVIASNDFGKVSKKLMIYVYQTPEITTTELSDATVGKKYTKALKKSGTTPYTWTIEGTLPDGITFDTKHGKFSGTPKVNGSADVRVTLSNAVGTVAKVYHLTVNAIPPAISTNALKNGTCGKAYSAIIKAPRGTQPITLSMEGTLPAGLSFDSSTGKITGTPTATGSFNISVTATNTGGSVTKEYTLTIKAVPPKITTKKLNDATVNEPYNMSLDVTGTAPITWSTTGLPSGLSITDEGKITGTPTEFGTFRPKVSAQNEARTVTSSYVLKVLSAPVFSESGRLASGTEGRGYSYRMKTTGTKPITYSVARGSLPSGLTLNSKTGKLSGKLSSSGTFSFTVRASNSAGAASADFSVTIAAKPTTTTSNTTAVRNVETEPSDGYMLENVGGAPSGKDYEGEYIIVAELPEVSVDVSGMYDFEVVLDENAPVGAKLLWLARSDDPSEDDDVAEFYDSDGGEIDSVPESRKLSVSAWLNKDVIYKPAVAIITH